MKKLKIKEIKLEKDFLQDQKQLAKENRQILDKQDIKMIDIMGSVGTGKTSLIEQIVKTLKDELHIVVLNGDLATTIDQERILQCGVSALQVNTGKECHLDASIVRKVLEGIDLDVTDLVIVENVGNLICPVDFPLGSHMRILVISVTDGPYVVLKHPYVFAEINYVVITKTDLASFLEVDLSQMIREIQTINASARIFQVSCKTREGVEELVAELKEVL